MANDIAAQVTAEKYRAKLPCTPKDPKAPDDACARKILSHYGLLLFRRPLTAAELENPVGLSHSITERTNDFYAGLRYGLSMLLQLPDFLFRKEVAVPSADGKIGTLDSYSRATRLSFLMWNTTPDAELLRAAGNGELNTSEGLAKQVDRLMASPRLDAGMRAFFDDMLELDTFDTVSKDSLLYPKWGSAMATSAREETLRTVIDLTLHDNGDIRDLMTTRQTYIDRSLAVLYGVPFPFTADWVKYEFPAESGRSGILTQVSMLSMFSHPGRSSPTKRGVAMIEIFLCSPTPTPPNNVDFSVVNDPNSPMKTLRERLMAHATNPVCAACHTAQRSRRAFAGGFRHHRRLSHHRERRADRCLRHHPGPYLRRRPGAGPVYARQSAVSGLRCAKALFLQPRRKEFQRRRFSRTPTRRSRIPGFACARCSKAWQLSDSFYAAGCRKPVRQ